jgi:hypothetical protein
VETIPFLFFLIKLFLLGKEKVWDERRRTRLRVVIMKEEAWYQIDGPSVESALERVPEIFPAVASIYIKGEKLIVVEYELWKQKVKAKQL